MVFAQRYLRVTKYVQQSVHLIAIALPEFDQSFIFVTQKQHRRFQFLNGSLYRNNLQYRMILYSGK